MIIYNVSPGDTIYKIAQKYQTSPQSIQKDNQINDPSQIPVGTSLVVRNRPEHTVQPGDTLYDIARTYGITLKELERLNPQIRDSGSLHLGQSVYLPGQKLRKILVNGYARPQKLEIVETALGYLTFMGMFSYQVMSDASLTRINDGAYIAAAQAAHTAPRMVITNIDQSGDFSSDLASEILNSPSLQDRLLENAMSTMRTKGYTGLDVDFEYIYPQDKNRYSDFLRKAARELHANGYTLSVAVAPKTSSTQAGLLYEGHDYSAIGAYADYVVIMTYEWGYMYGPPLPVAPINKVKGVLDYATTVIPSRKILMGIPNYGYDWTLPYVKGSAAKSLSIPQAFELAKSTGAQIKFDYAAQSPYFYYYDQNAQQHIVWFEDARSIYAKLTLVTDYRLGGVSYWTVNNLFLQNWLVLDSMYEIVKIN